MKTANMTTTITATATKIMVVEDESIIALDIKRSLSRLGYVVTGVAASGDAALMKIKENRPHLVLMDIHLKGDMNGIQVSEVIKSDFQLPIIYLTANADSSTFQSAQSTNPHAYLLKPFDEKALGIAVEVALNQHRKAQAVKASEHWYANAFQCLNEAVVATDSEGDIVFMNALAEEMTGTSLHKAINQPVKNILSFQKKIQQTDRLSASEAESVRSIVRHVLSRGKTILLSPDTHLVTESQAFTPIEGSATSLRDASGRITGSLFIFRAIESQTTPIADLSQQEDANSIPANELSLNAQATTLPAEDIALIKTFSKAFIEGEPIFLSTANLVVSSGEGQTTLTSRKNGTIVSVKQVKDKLTAIVDQGSDYWEVVRHMLVENSFFPVGQRTNGTCHFQHRAIPEDSQIFHTSAMELWETWHGKARPGSCPNSALTAKLSRASIIVLRRGSWYRIQSLIVKGEALHIKTVAGEIFTSLEDLLIWGARV
ncbi:MAG: response regulator [Cyanobacteria bacterium J06581_3]